MILPAMRRLRPIKPKQTHLDRMLSMLSVREGEVMLLAAEGLSNKEVAQRLKISPITVKVHLHHVFQKLAIHNRTRLAALVWSGRKRTALSNERGRLMARRRDLNARQARRRFLSHRTR